MSELLLSAVQTKEAQKTFYPTPKAVADVMLKEIDWRFIDSVLEPSAGKGDLVEAIMREMDVNMCNARIITRDRGEDGQLEVKYHYDKVNIDCIEIDPNLRAIMKDKGLRVVHDDFLTLETYKQYDLIVMNPPFDKGAEHLLKALDVQKRGGGIICLLNAETLRNPYSYTRQILAEELKKYGAEISYIQDGFTNAERRTGVEVAVVKCSIPRSAKEDGDILRNLRRDQMKSIQKRTDTETSFLAKNDFVQAIVDSYNFEVSAGLRLFDEYESLKPYLKSKIEEDSRDTMLQLVLRNSGHHGMTYDATVNDYIKAVRMKYWERLFQRRDFVKGLTENLKRDLYAQVEKLSDYDFSLHNILQLQVDMSKKVNQGIKQTIMKLFDNWTFKYHWDENSPNRHYFNGWRTNDAFTVNKKVIIPFYNAFSSWNGKFELGYEANKKLVDIEKVFDFLDGKIIKDVDYNIQAVLDKAVKEGQTKKVQFKYFKATFYKKGTCHIEFTNMDALQRFNWFAAKEKNWLPPCYGKKSYKDMDEEEKRVIDSFQGEEQYAYVMENQDYFLADAESQLLLGVG